VFDGGKPVSYDDKSFISPQGTHRLHNIVLGGSIKRTGGFVQHQYRRVVIKCTGDTDTLALPPGKADAALTNLRFKSLWQFIDELFELRSFYSTPDSSFIDLRKFV
jgi:hypothetical protein